MVTFLKDFKFDGIDIDYEKGRFTGGIKNYQNEFQDYKDFVIELRTQLNDPTKGNRPAALLTSASVEYSNWYNPADGLTYPDKTIQAHYDLRNVYDKIFIMTYDFNAHQPDPNIDCAGSKAGRLWHNSNLFSYNPKAKDLIFVPSKAIPPGTCPSNPAGSIVDAFYPFNSAADEVKKWTDASLPTAKLGLGLSFYGYNWSGGKMDGVSTGARNPNEFWKFTTSGSINPLVE